MSAEGRIIRFPKSLKFRLFSAFSIFILLISLAFTSLWVLNDIRVYKSNSAEKAQLLAGQLSGLVRLPLFAGNWEAVSGHAAEIARQSGVHSVTVFDASGVQVAEISTSGTTAGTEAIKGEAIVSSGDFGPSPDQVMTGGAGEITSIGKVIVAMNKADLNKHILTLLGTAALTGFLFWIIFIFIAYQIVRWGTKSLTPLFNGLKAIHNGDYSARIAVDSQDDLAEAATSINELAQTLQAREADNARLQQELIDSMKSEVREERRKIMAKLIQTNRMTSLGLLVSGAAHEINTPNGAIRLAGQKFGRVWKDAAKILEKIAVEEGDFVLGGINFNHAKVEVANSLELIDRCTSRIDQVVKDLREYSIGEQNQELESFSVNKVVNDALSIISAHGKMEKITLEKQLDENIPTIMGNRYQLGQVITNLLLNAMQSIPEGRRGLIAIITGVDPETGDIRVSVSDNGEGISGDIRGSLMEPFVSTRIDKGGSGLGLYISDHIISEHNGSLSFESSAGQGTVFTVRLPVQALQTQASSVMSGG